ncbi:MAG: DNA polymerase III subunit gamma/tau [Piscirickettsiaceae bacterium]|nr:DNA polymerase III subunit gamma/tau [Piscirickettsiaceae bacterium]
MSYLVLARKWRPKIFSEVVGQQHILRALINGLDQNRLHHAFLFAGVRGIGKTTLARILAKSLNCEQGISSSPCGACNSCKEVDNGHYIDLIEVDAASRTGVDDTRELIDNVRYAPSRGSYKVYLIDEVHMLSVSSFNALLKTLEEPPSYAKFLFATTEPQKLPATILSRCIQFNLRRLDLNQISGYLSHVLRQEDIDFELNALTVLARAADGSMRDALSLLDQAISFGGGSVNYEDVHQMLGTIEQTQLYNIVTFLLRKDGKNLLEQSMQLSFQCHDFTIVINELLSLLQRIAIVQMVPDIDHVEEWGRGVEHIRAFAQQFSPENIQLLYQIALHSKRDLLYAADPKSGFDMMLLRMLSFQPRMISKLSEHDSISEMGSGSIDEESFKDIPTVPALHSQKIIRQSSMNEKINVGKDKTRKITKDNWINIVGNLDLGTTLSRQLADNSVFISSIDDKIHLSLSPEFIHLATLKSKKCFNSALSKQLGYELSLIFEKSIDSTDNPKDSSSKQSLMKQQLAIESIHNDPDVDAIRQAFDARVVESSIRSID